jgi:hypothetical protein
VNFIKLVLSKLGFGFLYGSGFIIATATIGNFAFSYMEDDINEKKAAMAERDKEREEEHRLMFRDYDDSAKLKVSISKERIESEEFTLLGTIENNGDAKWSSVSLKAELYNEAGEFIDECSEYVTQTSIPGSKVNFKLSCGSCSKFQLRDYHSYELSITDARYSR